MYEICLRNYNVEINQSARHVLGSASSLLSTRSELGDGLLARSGICWDLIVEPCVNSTMNLKTGFKAEGSSSCARSILSTQFNLSQRAASVMCPQRDSEGAVARGSGQNFPRMKDVSFHVVQRLSVRHSCASVQMVEVVIEELRMY